MKKLTICLLLLTNLAQAQPPHHKKHKHHFYWLGFGVFVSGATTALTATKLIN